MSEQRALRPQTVLLMILMGAMAFVVLVSNILVKYPIHVHIGTFYLADIWTWGTFTYPFAFLVTDLANRTLGPAGARRVVFLGFIFAIALSYSFADERIAIASGIAFLLAQLLDVSIFNRLRAGIWWRAPLISSAIAAIVDTAIFYSLAFAAMFAVLGPALPFAIEPVSPLGVLTPEVPRWVSWAAHDLIMKVAVTALLLAPYRLLLPYLSQFREA